MELLEAISVSKIYTDGECQLKALDDVSLAVREGEFVAVTGASGSGKTTLLNILGGLETPTSGSVFVNGVSLGELSEEERTRFRLHHIGFVFQNYNLLPTINILENIVLPSRLLGRNPEFKDVERFAELLGISDKLYARPGVLSGGQQQRAAIARAMFTGPEILLADEPTGNLDSRSGMETICLMKEMCKEYGQTIVVVTHDERIAQAADRIIRIRDGKAAVLHE